MARNLIQRSFVFRSVVESNRLSPLYNRLPSNSFRTLISSETTAEPSLSSPFTAAIFSPSQSSVLPPFQYSRALCSDSGSSKMALVKSEQHFNDVLNQVQDKSLPAIFYFTAAWCGPCRFISPVIAELSEKYPHVATYKIDIDQEEIQDTLSRLQITAVPTLHFFENGRKADEIIGADVERLKHIMDKLYKKTDLEVEIDGLQSLK